MGEEFEHRQHFYLSARSPPHSHPITSSGVGHNKQQTAARTPLSFSPCCASPRRCSLAHLSCTSLLPSHTPHTAFTTACVAESLCGH
jgi:hypothetical protein